MFAGEKADYVVEEEDIQIINPTTGTTTDKVTPFMSDFVVKVFVSNLGKATNDSIELEVIRTLSNGEEISIASKKVPGPAYQQAYHISVPNDIFEGDGMNDISVIIDQKDKVSENCEDNNYSKKTIQIEGNCEMAESIAEIEDVVIMDSDNTASLTLANLDENYTFEWSDGSSKNALEVTEQGIYTVNIIDDLGCNVEKTFKVYPNDLVYPGDANYDGIANMYDLLAIGLGYNFEGTERDERDIKDWNGQPSFDWEINVLAEGEGFLDAKHPDCDGDGLINDNDIIAIKANYQQIIGKQANALAEMEAALFVEATDTIIPGYEHVFSVNLGTPQKPAEDIYGIAFTAEFTLAESWRKRYNSIKRPNGNLWKLLVGRERRKHDCDGFLLQKHPNLGRSSFS